MTTVMDWREFLTSVVAPSIVLASLLYLWVRRQKPLQADTQPIEPPTAPASVKAGTSENADVIAVRVDEPDQPPAKQLVDLMKEIAAVRAKADSAALTADTLQTTITTLGRSFDDLRQGTVAASTFEGRIQEVNDRIASLNEQLGSLLEEKTILRDQATSIRNDLVTLQELLEEEATWRKLVLIASKPGSQHWKLLEKKWQLLQRNPPLRERLIAMWKSTPIMNLGEHFLRLLQLSSQQWPLVRQRTENVPGRISYWRDLHKHVKRQFVAVSNFFRRLEEFDASARQTFDDGTRGMTLAEFDIGWGHVIEPSAVAELAPVQVDRYADNAAQKLLETWVTPVVRLHHELFVVPRYEYTEPLRSQILDELQHTMNRDGFLSLADDDVAAAARQLEVDYFPIVPYDHHVSEIGRHLNRAAVISKELEEWLGYPRQVDGPIILRVEKLALKRRTAPSEMIDGGASLIIGKNTNV